MFKNIIVRKPSKSISEGITSAPQLGKPNYENALIQHNNYIETLKKCGVTVEVLDELADFPDSCFVEDVAVVTAKCAIVTNPGASSRNKETLYIVDTLKKYFDENDIHYIKFPGTLDGGDVMMVGNHFYVGQSARTNSEGIKQFIEILNKYGFSGSEVTLEEVLHLKTGVNYIENNTLLVSGEFINKEDFKDFKKIIVPEDEAYASNCIWVNNYVIVPSGYPKVKKLIEDAGYKVICTDTSEFRKIDGGLSCLSLRF
ncbi:dimethylarginine dimethylaminohydrolase family protein [Fusobacterium sp.]|uniref:dimethylarginine dimethylaminohydrolase family protein n=1 Tax=Fusobacterium sp. TaxID=68766 RepID=UPI00261EF506|nr:arginine deiminase family protein [Fusobacterium sp.]